MPTVPTIARLLFSFRGRAGRIPFWLVWVSWVLIIQVVDYAWDAGISAVLFASYGTVTTIAIRVLIAVPALVSGVAVSVRRLHDRDKSAWWLVPYGLVPTAIGPLTLTLLPIDYVTLITASIASAALSLWALVDLGLIPGTRGPNRYGVDPRAPLAVAEAFD
jgi:uncharacterized membrane protein YhaH (DUF805 family)